LKNIFLRLDSDKIRALMLLVTGGSSKAMVCCGKGICAQDALATKQEQSQYSLGNRVQWKQVQGLVLEIAP